jgi:drug/metabolite transporter (DMT)-like permease
MTTAAETAALAERRLPPIIEIGVVAMALAIAGVIYTSAHIPGTPNLVPAVVLLAGSAAIVLVNAILLSRIRDFAWSVFWTVGAWTLLAYSVIAGMLMFVFIYDNVPGKQLTLLLLTLAVFALDIPMMLAFSVARFQPPDRAS